MVRELELKLFPDKAFDLENVNEAVRRKLNLAPGQLTDLRILRRSIDARGSRPVYLLRVAAYIGEQPAPEPALLSFFSRSTTNPRSSSSARGPQGTLQPLS